MSIRLIRTSKTCSKAEAKGFEPSNEISSVTPLAGERLQPLGHASIIKEEMEGFEPSHALTRLTDFESVLFSHLSTSPY